MSEWQTVGLIRAGESFPRGTKGVADLAGGVRLVPTPALFEKPGFVEWLRACLGSEEIDFAGYAFTYEYEAEGLGDPDPADPKRSKQAAAAERLQLAGVALWLTSVGRPTTAACAHAPLDRIGGSEAWQVHRVEPLIPHQFDNFLQLTEAREMTVREVAGPLYSLPRPSPLWSCVRFLFLALTEGKADTRIAMLWISLEALFGSADAGPDSSRELYRRMGAFFSSNRKEQLEAFEIAKSGYQMRCKAVHGGRTADVPPDVLLERNREAEGMLRTALNRILRDPRLLETFGDELKRETFTSARADEFTAQDGMQKSTRETCPSCGAVKKSRAVK